MHSTGSRILGWVCNTTVRCHVLTGETCRRGEEPANSPWRRGQWFILACRRDDRRCGQQIWDSWHFPYEIQVSQPKQEKKKYHLMDLHPWWVRIGTVAVVAWTEDLFTLGTYTSPSVCLGKSRGWGFDQGGKLGMWWGLAGVGRKGVVIGSGISKGDSAETFGEGMEGISWHKGQLAVMALSDRYVLLCKCMFIGFFKMQIKHLALYLDTGKKACHWLNKSLPLLLSWYVPLC